MISSVKFLKYRQAFLIFNLIHGLLIVGCASTGSIERIEATKPIYPLKTGYKTVAVDFVYLGDDKANSSVPDQLIGSIVDNLRDKNIFRKVYSKSGTLKNNFDLIVEVSPINESDADIAQSIFVWAGRSEIKTRVTLIDGKTGKNLEVVSLVVKQHLRQQFSRHLAWRKQLSALVNK